MKHTTSTLIPVMTPLSLTSTSIGDDYAYNYHIFYFCQSCIQKSGMLIKFNVYAFFDHVCVFQVHSKIKPYHKPKTSLVTGENFNFYGVDYNIWMTHYTTPTSN